MSIYLHVLKGCSPAPLANYLKALGILRLVCEQADGHARGWWEDETFHLLTKLSKEELETFFLEKYEPTPLLSPWNKGCGFFKGNDPGLVPLEQSQADRFERFRQGIAASRLLLDAISSADSIIRSIKSRTKTNKSFQTEEQRQAIEKSDVFRDCLSELQGEASKPDLSPDKKGEIMANESVIRSLVVKREQPPSRAEVEKLKVSAGYKRILAVADRRFKALKATLIPDCKRAWRGPHAEWMSAAVVLDENGNPDWPSLLGTGGNDGNLDFTNNFMQQLGALFDLGSETGKPKAATKSFLENCLWTAPANKLESAAIGQYQPGAAGGANSSTGFDGGNLVNGWDFVLMMEGTIVFASQATRRLDPVSVTRASAPFAVRSHAAGFATPGSEKAQRGEQWMPIWNQPATLRDVSAMFGEARVQLDRQITNRPVDVARAISRLGVARGIGSFVRYGYLERNGQSTLAVPLGRVAVRENPRAYLIDDLARWMSNLERRTREKNAPNRLIHAERCLAGAVFTALTHDYAKWWQAILLAAADVESLEASGTAFEAGPIPPLQPEWVAAANDGSAEVRLALALGSAFAEYGRNHRPLDPVRHHWLPLESDGRRFKLSDKRLVNDPRAVATGRDPLRDLAAVVERRLIEATMDGKRRSRLRAIPGCAARLDDVAAFLAGQLDVDLIVRLARSFMAIRWHQWKRDHAPIFERERIAVASDAEVASPRKSLTPLTPDEAWLALRLCVLPFRLDESHDIPADERVVRLLMANDAGRAIDVARRRLIAVGIRPPFEVGTANPNIARLWAAAMAFPISQYTARHIAKQLDPRLK